MRQIVHRHLGKVVAGAAIAVAGTAVMVGVTLPGDVSADSRNASSQQQGENGSGQNQAGGNQNGQNQPGVAEEAAPEGEKGIGTDPLTDDELKRAEQIALNSQGLRASSRDVTDDTGPQRLSTELTERDPTGADGPSAPRRADITYYDYKDDTLVTRTVNLETGKVEHSDTQSGVQPPPSREEAAEAVKLLLDSPVSAGLKKDYKDATSKTLTKPDQLQVSGGIYRVGEGSGRAAALKDCGKHRCVRLFTKVKNGPWIDTRTLVIDLSARTVARIS